MADVNEDRRTDEERLLDGYARRVGLQDEDVLYIRTLLHRAYRAGVAAGRSTMRRRTPAMADATPDDADRRAAELTSGLCGLLLKYTWIGPPSMMPPQDFGSVGDDGVVVLTERIAAAIREAVGAERERCLTFAEAWNDTSAGRT